MTDLKSPDNLSEWHQYKSSSTGIISPNGNAPLLVKPSTSSLTSVQTLHSIDELKSTRIDSIDISRQPSLNILRQESIHEPSILMIHSSEKKFLTDC